MQVSITRYPVRHQHLKPFIKYYWAMESTEVVHLQHKLLPVNAVDLIFNLSDPILYANSAHTQSELNGLEWHDVKKIHFSGIRNQCQYIKQQGKIKVIGVSFWSHGSYAFFKEPMSVFKNVTVNLEEVQKSFVNEVESNLDASLPLSTNINCIEKALLRTMHLPEAGMIDFLRLHEFSHKMPIIPIEMFCKQNHVSAKTLERVCLKLVGVSPKALQRITRFHCVVNELIEPNCSFDFTKLAYDFNYYDQAHFIKEFKAFSGATPRQFVKERLSIKEVATVQL